MSDEVSPYAGRTVRLRLRRPIEDACGLRVTVLEGPDRGLCRELEDGECVIGRSPSANLTLRDPTVSLHHVELKAARGEIVVVDLESLNRTSCAGLSLMNATVPSSTDLQVGASIVRVEILSRLGTATGSEPSTFGRLRAQSGAMRKLFWLFERVASSDLSVLIEGSATEAYYAAQEIHARSHHASGPFVTFDCGAATGPVAEALLFGEASPSSSSSSSSSTSSSPARGVLDSAQNGTLFLSDVGLLSLDVQLRLQRALAAPNGGIAVRVLACSADDLRIVVNRERFREELYDRIAQVRARIPPFGERPEDIPFLVLEILQRLRPDVDAARSISRAALRELKSRPFVGGLRELQAVVERTALIASGPVITPADLAMERMMAGERARTTGGVIGRRQTKASDGIDDDGGAGGGDHDDQQQLSGFKDTKRTLVDQFERDYLVKLIAHCGDNLSAASNVSGVERHHLRKLFRKHGLRSRDRDE